MKRSTLLFLSLVTCLSSFAQTPEWKKEQIMPTAELAQKITTNAADVPVIFNVGPMENIKKAVFVGRATSATFKQQMQSNLNMVNKNRTVVVYCGCCSFSSCPNLKPAYDALISLGYKNAKVLDLPVGIKPDWVAKGYPVED